MTARIADTQQGRDAVALLDEGALDSLSVGFVPIEDRKDKDGVTHRRKVRLLETSLVSWPAYENAKLTNHRNNNQEETPMTEQAEEMDRSPGQAHQPPGRTGRDSARHRDHADQPAPISSAARRRWANTTARANLLKALVSDDTGKAEAAGKPTMRCCPVTTPVP